MSNTYTHSEAVLDVRQNVATQYPNDEWNPQPLPEQFDSAAGEPKFSVALEVLSKDGTWHPTELHFTTAQVASFGAKPPRVEMRLIRRKDGTSAWYPEYQATKGRGVAAETQF